MEEQQAVLLLKKGDLRGLETLVRLYYFQAVRAAYLIIRDSAQAEDIVQAAFINAVEKIDQLTSDRFGAWFHRSVINAAIKATNKQKNLLSIDEGEDENMRFLASWLIDPNPSPEEMIETTDLRQGIWKALAKLTPNERAVVVSKYYLGLSEVEIAQHYNTPLSTVKWRLFRAREKLRTLLIPFRDSSDSNKFKLISHRGKRQA
jgi:RNA polymerase sigma-70 factor (ECF subfamily)